jgi:phosphatidylserine decarboxylase
MPFLFSTTFGTLPDLVVKGERIGLIKMGSQVDIILPPDVQVLVKEGDRVVAGETVIASS